MATPHTLSSIPPLGESAGNEPADRSASNARAGMTTKRVILSAKTKARISIGVMTTKRTLSSMPLPQESAGDEPADQPAIARNAMAGMTTKRMLSPLSDSEESADESIDGSTQLDQLVPLKLSTETLGTDIINFNVGPTPTTFSVHKKLFCDKGFQCEEGTNNVVNLPEHNTKTFDGVVNWMYRDQIPPSSEFLDTPEAYDLYCRAEIQPLYFLAERLHLRELMSKLLDKIRIVACKYPLGYPTAFDVRAVYQNTPPSSNLRKYCLASFVDTWRRRHDEADLTAFANLALEFPEMGRDYILLRSKCEEKDDREEEMSPHARSRPTSSLLHHPSPKKRPRPERSPDTAQMNREVTAYE